MTSLLSAWALGAEGRGDLAIITLFPFICVLITGFGFPYAHRYWLARHPERSSSILTFTIVFTIISSSITVLISEFLIPLYVGERTPQVKLLLRLFLLNIPVLMFMEMFRGILEGARCFGWIGASRMTFIFTQAGGYLIFWLFGYLTLPVAIAIITVGQLLGLGIMAAAIWYELRPHLSWNWRAVRDEFDYAVRSYPGILTEHGVLRLDQVLLAGMASSFVMGLYIVAVALAEITAMLASSVADVLLPEVAASDSVDKSTKLLGKSLRLTFYAHLTVLIPLWLTAPSILGWVYGQEFLAASGALKILLLASVVWSVGAIMISGLNGFGYPGLSTLARIASAVSTVVALLWALPKWGIIGAAGASLFGYGVMLLFALFWLHRKCGSKFWNALRPERDDISFANLKKLIKWESPRTQEVLPRPIRRNV